MIQSRAQLPPKQLPFEAGFSGARHRIGIEVDSIICAFKCFEAFAQRDADYPGGHLGAQVESMGLAPYNQHRVINDFLDQVWPSRYLLDKSFEPWVIAAPQRIECGPVPTGDLVDEGNLVQRRRNPLLDPCYGAVGFATQHSEVTLEGPPAAKVFNQ